MLVLLKIIIVSTYVYRVNGFKVSFVPSGSEYEGEVEINLNGEWSTVCDNKWRALMEFKCSKSAGFESESENDAQNGSYRIRFDYV